ncbi:MAG: rod shape-determining protein MreC [Mariprofundaceae bacterium]|nr:rod shape-determining protein MreC [Mariprofundaceae bacterium]
MRSGVAYQVRHFWWLLLFLVALILVAYLPVGQKLSLAIAPVLHVVQAPVRWYDAAYLWFESSQTLQTKYSQLGELQLQQQSRSLELTALRTENRQLRRLLKISQTSTYTWQVARVMSRSPEEKSRSLILDVSHAQRDDIIISDEGLVGLVDEVSPQYAVVRTILDASIAVPVTTKKSHLAALIRGDGTHLLVDFVPIDLAPEVGDILLTSGAGGLYPAGIPVAVVESVQAIEDGVFAQVHASPVAHWQRNAWLAIASQQH